MICAERVFLLRAILYPVRLKKAHISLRRKCFMQSKEQGFLDKVFHLSENHTTVKTEVIAGITTFMTMAYILAVNPSILSASGMDSGAVFTATALASCFATLLMAAFANYPFVLAPGMGLNAYFAYTVVIQMGYSWQTAPEPRP